MGICEENGWSRETIFTLRETAVDACHEARKAHRDARIALSLDDEEGWEEALDAGEDAAMRAEQAAQEAQQILDEERGNDFHYSAVAKAHAAAHLAVRCARDIRFL